MSVIVPHLERKQLDLLIAGLAQSLRALAKDYKFLSDEFRPNSFEKSVADILASNQTAMVEGLKPGDEVLVIRSLDELAREALKFP